MEPDELKRLSRTMAKALRHAPWEFELEIDDDGWVSVQALLDSLRANRRAWRGLTEKDFSTVMAMSDKKRYEMENGRIRALYGHSLPTRLAKTPGVPPEVLYHGTVRDVLPIILREGLKPMSRQYVHYSVEKETAEVVARRKGPNVIILSVRAADAHRDGYQFYEGNETVWLSDNVPAAYLVVPK